MMITLVDGDTVLVKHSKFTDGKWEKGQILKFDDAFYEIRLYRDKFLVINKNDVIYDINIIKVDSDFNMACNNCKHFDKTLCEVPCNNCLLGHKHCNWEPGNSLKNKDKLRGLDINAFSIDEGPFNDKKVDYSYISTKRCGLVNELERQMHKQLLASPLKIEKLDIESTYPKLEYKLDYSKNRPNHSDNIDVLRYCVNDERALAALPTNFNKKENKNMKKQQKKRDRNIIKVKDTETRKIKEVMFNGPATIIKWNPTWHQLAYNEVADKTVTVCKEPDKLDKTTGFLLAVLKEVLTNQSYGNILEKIDEINEFDESSKHNKCPKETVALLNEAAEAMANAFHIGSRVKYIHGKLVYRVVDCAYIPTKHEMYYTLSAYQNDILSGHETPKVYNVAHHRLKQVKKR